MRTEQEVADRMWWFFAAGWMLALGFVYLMDDRVFSMRTGLVCLGFGVLFAWQAMRYRPWSSRPGAKTKEQA